MGAVPILENNIHQTMDWIYAIEEACRWDEENQKKAFTALRAVLHEIRDLLPLERAAQLSAQLPIVIRGIFFENWHPRYIPVQEIKKNDFLEAIAQSLYPYQDMNVEETTKGVLQVLGEKLPSGELENIIQYMSKEIQELYQK
ncbi:MAG: DUF2267 domain-containing protein [Candidatus Paracaedibacter sp.]